MVIEKSITLLMQGYVNQVDMISTLSIAGIGAIFFIWTRALGIFQDANLKQFKHSYFLFIPAILLSASVAMEYLIIGLTNGYYFEISQGFQVIKGKEKTINDASMYFVKEYQYKIQEYMQIQLLICITGIFLMLAWLGHSFFSPKTTKLNQEEA